MRRKAGKENGRKERNEKRKEQERWVDASGEKASLSDAIDGVRKAKEATWR